MSVADRPGEPPAIFRREGDHWTIAYEGRHVRLRDMKGLHYLARLLARPGQAVTVDELVVHDPATRRRREGARTDAGDAERDRKAVTNRIRQAIARLAALHPELGRHLLNSVRTGARCAYTPERTVSWSAV